MIELKKVTKTFEDKKILENFSYEFKKGSTTFILGESGIGKTTLINMILGIQKPDSGEIIKKAKKTSSIFQEDRLIENISARQNIELVLEKKEEKSKISEAFTSVGLEGEEDTLVYNLSGGMKRRIAIIRGILYNSELIIMDEPFKGLDDENRKKTINFIKNNLNNRTLIIISHDLRDMEDFKGDALKL